MKKREFISKLILIILIPLILAAGVFLLDGERYYLIGTLIICAALAAFFFSYESREKHIREIVTVSVLCAIAVAGRMTFGFIPQLKPILAITIIAGISLGSQSGFIVGAVSAFVSNFFFGQGPWTPWQMFALGLCGFLAGVLFKQGRMPQKTLPVSIYGAVAAMVVYGTIADMSSLFIFGSKINIEMALSVYTLGLEFNLRHAAATFVFLMLLTYPFLFILGRLKKKYGMYNSDLR